METPKGKDASIDYETVMEMTRRIFSIVSAGDGVRNTTSAGEEGSEKPDEAVQD